MRTSAGANSVVVLSHGLWQRRFGGRDDALGKTLAMNGRAMQIIGVMPEGFAFPSRETQFWVPTARVGTAAREPRIALAAGHRPA